MPENGPAWQKLVRVVLRPTPWVDACRDAFAALDQKPVCRHMAGDLWAAYVLLTATDLEPVTEEQRDELGLDNAGLHILAVRNLIDVIENIEREGDGGTWMLSEDGENEEGLIFVPAVWDWIAEFIIGAPVVCMPSRDVLLVTGSDDEDGLERVAEAASDVYEQDEEPISTTMLLREGARWVEFAPKR